MDIKQYIYKTAEAKHNNIPKRKQLRNIWFTKKTKWQRSDITLRVGPPVESCHSKLETTQHKLTQTNNSIILKNKSYIRFAPSKSTRVQEWTSPPLQMREMCFYSTWFCWKVREKKGESSSCHWMTNLIWIEILLLAATSQNSEKLGVIPPSISLLCFTFWGNWSLID